MPFVTLVSSINSEIHDINRKMCAAAGVQIDKKKFMGGRGGRDAICPL
jgi:hypothetical protein